eukprot:UN02276
MEAKVPGSESAKTYNSMGQENHMSWSPLISTEPQPLVMLTDRSYEHRNIIKQRGGEDKTLAFHVVKTLDEKYGIKGTVSYGSILSGSDKFAEWFEAFPEQTRGPPREKQQHGFPADLTVVVPAEQLVEYAEKKLLSLPNQSKATIAKMTDTDQTKRLTARQRFNLQNQQPEDMRGKKPILSPLPPGVAIERKQKLKKKNNNKKLHNKNP